MFEHQIIQEYLLELQLVAEAENVINICDKSTWGDHDLSRLEELLWNDIGPIPCQTQYMENVVQTSGWVGKNNRGEKRRSDNGRLHSFVVRDAKQLHLAEKRQEVLRNPMEQKRQLGKKELQNYYNHVNFTMKSIEKARPELGDARYKELKDRVTDYSKRSSENDRQANLEDLKKGVKQPRKITDTQRLNKVDKSGRALGKATLSFLTVNKHRHLFIAECKARRIKLSETQRASRSDKEWRDLLRKDQASCDVTDDNKGQDGIDYRKIQEVKPMSDELIEWVKTEQEKYYDKQDKSRSSKK
jgi:hypothetical protein